MNRFKIILLHSVCWLGFCTAQTANIFPEKSMMNAVGAGDSLLVYECFVRERLPGEIIADTVKKNYSVTYKTVLTRTGQGWLAATYTSSCSDFPNRKFSGLKIREKPYWNFTLVSKGKADEDHMRKLSVYEQRGREAMEYDYPITRYTRHQLIFKKGKDFRQLVVDRGTGPVFGP